MQFAGTRLRVDITGVLYVGGFFTPIVAARERPEFDIKPPLGPSSRLFPEVFATIRYFRKTTLARLPVIPLAILSQQVTSANDHVVGLHRSFRPSGGLPSEKPRIRHRWICLQLLVPKVWTTEASGQMKYLFEVVSNNKLLQLN